MEVRDIRIPKRRTCKEAHFLLEVKRGSQVQEFLIRSCVPAHSFYGLHELLGVSGRHFVDIKIVGGDLELLRKVLKVLGASLVGVQKLYEDEWCVYYELELEERGLDLTPAQLQFLEECRREGREWQDGTSFDVDPPSYKYRDPWDGAH